MEQQTYLTVVKMLNAFPQAAGNPDLTLATYEEALGSVSSQATVEAANRFIGGLVEGQNKTFAPSVAEFVSEARRLDQLKRDVERYRDRTALPAPSGRSNGKAPFEIRREQARQRFAGRELLFEDVSHARFQQLVHSRELPPGAQWCPTLGAVFGPELKKQAAE